MLQVLKGHREWVSVLKEAMLFCNHSTDVYTGPHAKQLHLVSEQLARGIMCLSHGLVLWSVITAIPRTRLPIFIIVFIIFWKL